MLRYLSWTFAAALALVMAALISGSEALMAQSTDKEPASASRDFEHGKTETIAKMEQGRGPAVRVVYPGLWQEAGFEAQSKTQKPEKAEALPAQVALTPDSIPAYERPLLQQSITQNSTKLAQLVDLNTSTVEQLNTIVGGGMIGKAVFRGRPYQSTEDLVSKRILSRAKFEQIRMRVSVAKL
ncbi:MAG: hypothetical protein NVS1B11_37930 [Terriglobales bacterium]